MSTDRGNTTEAAMRAWAKGSLPAEVAVEITLTTTLREQFINLDGGYGTWLDTSAVDDLAIPQWELLLTAAADRDDPAYLSGSATVLCILCENLAHGTSADHIYLSDLWKLDTRNRAAVLAALTKGLSR